MNNPGQKTDKPPETSLSDIPNDVLDDNLKLCEEYFEFKGKQLLLTHCPKCDGLYVFNPKTGEHYSCSCKTYSCPYCGHRKLYKLKEGIKKVLENYEHIRLFTFTFRTSCFENPQHALNTCSEIWRRFINNLRRCTALSDKQRCVQFIKVIEFTNRGYPHYHVFILDFIPWQIAQGLWNNSINTVLSSTGHNGHVNIRHSFTASQAADYVCSYVTKSIKRLQGSLRVWSRSSSLTIFEPRATSSDFVFINARSFKLNLSMFSITSLLYKYLIDLSDNLFEKKEKMVSAWSQDTS
jgi:uncharacterized Zn finger protein (UPF0148 family)